MAKLSQAQKIAELLKQNPNKRFKARQIAEMITSLYPEDYVEKRDNPRFSDENKFITQVVAEIGAHKNQILKQSENIKWQDNPRPRVYWYEDLSVANDDDTETNLNSPSAVKKQSNAQRAVPQTVSRPNKQVLVDSHPNALVKKETDDLADLLGSTRRAFASDEDTSNNQILIADLESSNNLVKQDEIEFDKQQTPSQKLASQYESTQPVSTDDELYPLLMEYLNSEHQLYCLRIDAKRSKNKNTTDGNKWLHPAIVAMEPIAQHWHQHVKTCVLESGSQSVRLWSFEVKQVLTMENIRQSFFQAVSNSSWASEGYLVATTIADSRVESELRMLSALHGIGVILLSVENPFESELLLPAQKRPEINWQLVNRIVDENADFKEFIDLVANYYQTGRVRKKDWNH